MKISLVGYMGSGKTTIGKSLSEKIGLEFIDLDNFIEQKHKKSISSIFSEFGEIKFRKLERDALVELFNSNKNFVLSLGGGTPVYYDNINLINQNSISFYLRLGPLDLATRLQNQIEHRPLLSHLNDEDLVEYIAKHLFERRAFYEQAHQTIDIKGKVENEIIEEIMHHPLLLK